MPRIVDNVDPQQWEALLQRSPYATPFQSAAFYRFLSGQTCCSPFCLGVEDDGRLQGVMTAMVQCEGGALKRFFTRRAIVNGGPLLSDNISHEAVTLLLRSCRKRLKSQAIYLETRNFHDYTPFRHLFEQCAYHYDPHYNFQLAIDDDPRSHYQKKSLSVLRAGQRLHVRIEEHPSLLQVQQFYQLLLTLYRKRVRTPLPPWSFFASAYQLSEFHYLCALDSNSRVVGGIMLADLDKRASYVWYEASDDNCRQLKIPTVLYDAAIMRCARQGIAVLDFMGAGSPGDGGYGVRKFKSHFGGTLVEQGRYKAILHPLLYHIGTAGVKLLKHLP